MIRTASIVRSALGSGERLVVQPPCPLLPVEPAVASEQIVYVDPAHRFQEFLGFGGAFTESSAIALAAAPPATQEAVLRSYFAAEGGNGYRFCRVHMGSCDFSLGNWHHAEKPGDFALDSFTIERDRKHLLPLIKRSITIAGGALRLLLSPWSPPAWMKTNGLQIQGGRLKPECRDAWALCFVKFIQAYAEEGVPIWGLTVQNEPEATQPWESCLFTAEEERDFIRDHLAPALERAGLNRIEIIGWDHNREKMVQRAAVYYADPVVRKRMWGVGFHWYCGDEFDNVRLVHDAWPEKHLLFTEGCQEGGPHPGSWDVAERYARSIINDLNRWTEGWIDWNLILDQTGGSNHVGNLCSAPVLIDSTTGAANWNPSFAAIGHFSRFIRPGARRLLCATMRDFVEATAFVNPDGSIVVVVLNRGDTRLPLRIQVGQAGSVVFASPGHSLATAVLPG